MRKVIIASVAAVAALPFMALTALAAEHTAVVDTAVAGGVDQATDLITNNIPLILGVTVVWIGLAFGRKLLRRVMGS